MFDNIQWLAPVPVMLSDPLGPHWTRGYPLPYPLLILLCVTPRTKNQIEIFQFLLLDFTTSAVIRTGATTIINHKPGTVIHVSINPLR